jgi:hypothetical protein
MGEILVTVFGLAAISLGALWTFVMRPAPETDEQLFERLVVTISETLKVRSPNSFQGQLRVAYVSIRERIEEGGADFYFNQRLFAEALIRNWPKKPAEKVYLLLAQSTVQSKT